MTEGMMEMKDYGIQRSAVIPASVEITETKVFLATDVSEINVLMDNQEHFEYEFNLVEYDKDEYIQMISDKNLELEQQITNTQIALCDVYEMLM